MPASEQSADPRYTVSLMGEAELLKGSFEEAASIAAVVPEPLRVVAFERALDEVLGGPPDEASRKRTAGSSSAKQRRRPRKGPLNASSFEEVAGRINRTEHSEITEAMPVLQRSLAILKIAKDLGVDGLPAPRIAEILTEKFRIKTYRQHVSEQLSGATKLVDRDKDGRGFTYRIMGAGEKVLAEFTSGKGAATATDSSEARARKPKGRSKRKNPGSKAEPRKKPTKASGGRPGPKAAIKTLIDAGFFSEARTMGDIQDRLKDKSGYVYKSTDLSPALGRLLRDGQLDRDRNENGQYEYQQS